MDKQCYIHTMKYYAAILRKLLIYATTCMKLNDMPSERSLPQKEYILYSYDSICMKF